MLQVSIDKILPVTEARANIARLVSEVEKGNVYVLTRGGKPAAVMVPVEKAEKILSDEFAGNNQQLAVKDTTTNQPVKFKPVKRSVTKRPEPTVDIVQSHTEQNLPTVNESADTVPAGIDLDKVETELAKFE